MAATLANAFGAGAAVAHQKLTVVQVHPLPTSDSGGATSFLVVMALVVGGYLAATISLVFGGAATRHRRLIALVIVSLAGSLSTSLIAGPFIGALPSSKFVVLWALFLLVMTAVAFSTAALQTLFGAAGTLIVVVLFVIFGAPAAGGTVPSAFLPEFWRVVGPYYLPARAQLPFATRSTLMATRSGLRSLFSSPTSSWGTDRGRDPATGQRARIGSRGGGRSRRGDDRRVARLQRGQCPTSY